MATAQADPTQVAQKWATNLGNSATQIRNGVQSLTTSPTTLAANAVAFWQQQVNTPAAAQKYQRNLQAVSLGSWQQSMISKGIPRIGPGAQAAIPKFTAFLQKFLPFEQNIANQVRAMPKATLQDRINRAVAQIQGNAGFAGQG